MRLKTMLQGQTYEFKNLKELFAKANEEKSGDRLAGLAAETVQERIAAKQVLAGLTLEDIRNHPLLPPEEDEVSRIIEEHVNDTIFADIKGWTVAKLREYILDDSVGDRELKRLSRGLTSEMIAAAGKLMSNLDLIHAANKVEIISRCNIAIGQKGTLASRLQPNHPTDNVDGMLASMKEGLSYGVGDAVIGINPVDDSVESVKRLLHATHDFIEAWNIPTQNCVLAHVTTQMKAIEQGAPAAMIFQSIAGTEAANRSFGISVSLLEEAQQMIMEKGTSRGPQRLYFETGQGSELSAEAHHGIDQMTLEARNYGFARKFDPYILNTVVGFIGPEYLYDNKQVIRAGLEDHFMGKMHGISMGVDICYTNHIRADQNDIEELGVLLTAAGVNFIIAAPMGDDCMLNYQSMSYHDIATLRQTLERKPAPKFAAWLEYMGITEDGRLTERAGDPTIFSE
ncbi:ethanolamine ammonia-lyase subunit EutB [Aneurinibacillus aneurinilyticus]|jgi:ethanolamine ammonia-lyase large subunit|uniref:Ethanolamine ammonia-lyase large subunit n=2 Tax=Aneurinibacillus aneurinilyticus TaxID=1391 RepID=A0A848CVT0_ANEAE|nr:ethanolamine ammonia-lyase subunit EutB [Aneurinibacillus aneurinilyticus]ERI04289.1 ethanolamine ammonia-lyase, large subunit [Aneurinibacillus aneurinilyticus ATCC 12856]MCI1692768.1 ethanolamine ammonia-lyase subunit EutB [Aneurinibacillus aneurinilyticus]MED0668724.1 ethanolamine ammonia-lyase subunit EutB [Aneurinibacillus aneurinilyticus]MED0708328.1 ethanolamine ammonia-lyase subunit EutB [Aneurinibacillus aneurinilyticus]MED0722084.1 ethanolamine ammonia-lyase subunit EutB [Aneurini